MYEPTITYINTPLSRVYFPNVQTKITDTSNKIKLPLGFVKYEETAKSNFETFALTMNPVVNTANPTGAMPVLDIGGAVFQPVEQVGGPKKLPTNLKEAHAVMHLITSQRKSKTNPAFDNLELKEISKNLNLPSTGKREELVSRILKAINDYMMLNL